jgi:oligopeptide/dipeptide ABC transporter ATP-binding protein
MPYSIGLLGSMPRIDADEKTRLTPIKGSPPSLINVAPGCPFGPRCPLHYAECDVAEPDLRPVDGRDHTAACIRVDEIVQTEVAAEDIFTADSADITLGEAAEVAAGGGTDAAEPVPIEEIIAHNEELAEQIEHGEHAPAVALTPEAAAGPAATAGSPGATAGSATAGSGAAGSGAAGSGAGGSGAGGSGPAGSGGGGSEQGAGGGLPADRTDDAAARRNPEEQA